MASWLHQLQIDGGLGRPSRRDVLVGAAGVALAGCRDEEVRQRQSPLDLGEPEMTSSLRQVMVPWVRASADGLMGGRLCLYNPAEVDQRVLVQGFTPAGVLVLHEELSGLLPAGRMEHLDLVELLERNDVPLPFDGSLWIGTTPSTGTHVMGLQGVSFEWHGPSHLAAVHALRDFGNSNHDDLWTELVLPGFVSTERYVTVVAVLNGSGDGLSEGLVARPEVVLRDDDGIEQVRTSLAELSPYASTHFAVDELPGAATLSSGSLQITESTVGLVAFAFLMDRENGGICCVDHLVDRHFSVVMTT